MLRRSRLRGRSKKREALATDYATFRRVLLSRHTYGCQYCHTWRGPLDVHHVLKPRARYLMDPKACVILCRTCHERTTAPYRRGRLVITPEPRGLRFAIVFAADKFAIR